ncbi:MAG: phosphoenolpyruvate carboxykinase (ATP), partial [Ectothiorhodospiraceae bacterium]|nr:phosphoenolpyruvate carboxykinase (ATP) [Ectothiorhodospiraceae bacterium]
MQTFGEVISSYGVENLGLKNLGTVYWNLTTPRLYEQSIRRREGVIAKDGPILCRTGDHTGRSPNDRFVVQEPETQGDIDWGNVNRPYDPERFETLFARVRAYLQHKDLFVFDGYAGADPKYRINVRVITEDAWHNMFARNMFIEETDHDKLRNFVPDYTVLNVPSFHADPKYDKTNSQTFILLHLAKKLVLIGGTAYAGEIKKSIFSVMNYLMPKKNVFSMHCSANYGKDRDDTALFFGLSGTGKTTLSSDPDRTLIGDDEHCWSDNGIFNIEGGCYAKVIRLDPEGEPDIYATTKRFGTILENVAYDEETRALDLDDDSLTENTRASYPISHIGNVDLGGIAGHPKSIIFLTADAFGVLPPISKLSREQAMYHFLSGYTAKVAGTERGVTEPRATFSTCFGAPFMPHHPSVYAKLLGDKINKHNADVWLINTGWTGGPYGVGKRMSLKHTRRMVTAALSGELKDVETFAHPIFGVHIPKKIEGVP